MHNNKLLFYADLHENYNTKYAYDGKPGLLKTQGDVTFDSDGFYGRGNNFGVWFNSECPSDTDLTFSCWIKKEGISNIGYSFGSSTPNNLQYKGLNYVEYNNYWLMQEYCYFLYVGNDYMTEAGVDTFITWSISYNGAGSYTVTFYKNGDKKRELTFTNTQWQGMGGSVFAISHYAGGSMRGHYHDFSVHQLLTDEEVDTLFKSNGIPKNV